MAPTAETVIVIGFRVGLKIALVVLKREEDGYIIPVT